ncbi:DUF1287 domain-containing protein [Clostridium sp. MB40-C1]|uniref:DUF1287 domain-containing protein n=1 Tax=Clostridium sp. MB40-C1 TaxID=3070996 RepID=UPI0027E0565E|nr:DUF1287 domain-containing protein [Clostridium sp. MB40-C1]WMJ81757.1 DUF1287 domain-containing protein [Clostridium sp. MB40-C1]
MKIKHKKRFIIISILIVIFALSYGILSYLSLLPQKIYKAENFGIETIHSKNDCNKNGIDDYTDILLGARTDAEKKPKYKSQYYVGGYPPDNEGVCSDVVWRAFKNAGYSLKDMVDEDIKNNLSKYPRITGKPDNNIDFRRVPNLKVFFDRNAKSCTLNPYKIEEWQPGDIVIFGKNYTHIGIISDKRNVRGIPFLIHNSAQPVREENVLIRWDKVRGITGHYRFEYTH